MIICIDCSEETKDQLDQLVKVGSYRDYSEAIALAVANQLLLHTRSKGQSALVLTGSTPRREARWNGRPDTATSDHARPTRPTSKTELPVNDLSQYGIPDVFKNRPVNPGGPIVEPSKDPKDQELEHGPESWLFGQYNKLLPAKASCRALSNLIVGDRGADLQEVGKEIAARATDLGGHLLMLDRRFRRDRDELHSTAFPSYSSADKGRLRYANQFVGAFNKDGELSGLLVDLKLINGLPNRKNEISLTQAGWAFALLPNPAFENPDEDNDDKFSAEERAFLLDHITKVVPRERNAYFLLLSAISEGGDSPEGLRTILATKLEAARDYDTPYLSTQRSGVVSRMNDLRLLYRQRDGVRVKYVVTAEGRAYLARESVTG